MNKAVIFFLILASVGAFLWLQRENLTVAESGAAGAGLAQPAPENSRYIIREKVKPGGYIGWHDTERDKMTSSAKKTRQASNYYFVCTEQGSSTRKIFLVTESAFHMERVGNVLSAQQVSAYQEVSDMEEPPLPPSFQFRRRDPK